MINNQTKIKKGKWKCQVHIQEFEEGIWKSNMQTKREIRSEN